MQYPSSVCDVVYYKFDLHSCQAFVSSCQAVIKQLSSSCQAVVRQSSGSRQAVVKQLSGSRQEVVKNCFALVLKNVLNLHARGHWKSFAWPCLTISFPKI